MLRHTTSSRISLQQPGAPLGQQRVIFYSHLRMEYSHNVKSHCWEKEYWVSLQNPRLGRLSTERTGRSNVEFFHASSLAYVPVWALPTRGTLSLSSFDRVDPGILLYEGNLPYESRCSVPSDTRWLVKWLPLHERVKINPFAFLPACGLIAFASKPVFFNLSEINSFCWPCVAEHLYAEVTEKNGTGDKWLRCIKG